MSLNIDMNKMSVMSIGDMLREKGNLTPLSKVDIERRDFEA